MTKILTSTFFAMTTVPIRWSSSPQIAYGRNCHFGNRGKVSFSYCCCVVELLTQQELKTPFHGEDENGFF